MMTTTDAQGRGAFEMKLVNEKKERELKSLYNIMGIYMYDAIKTL